MASQLFAGVIFGCIGFSAFLYGKKAARMNPMLLGVALMAYPYFVPNVLAMYAIGILLTAALFVVRD